VVNRRSIKFSRQHKGLEVRSAFQAIAKGTMIFVIEHGTHI